ncbi:hypothetical protein [Shimazuella alba]|uniref:FERM domain-containing protein n=1 Tax=Shimazuella alba TaxID=2690964 RepID=A0A6I4W3T0_9BACL|nr:hypothetical protein [Shimazuella alba]MXQ55434.1 hypothetical protein [Shimazuella alba]
MTLKESATNKYWIALGMIQPEWIYMSHFLDEEEEVLEEPVVPLISLPETRIIFRARFDP